MRYEIKGGSFPIVVCQLESGEQMITEKGSMVWMTPNMQMDTRGGGLGKMVRQGVFRREHVPEHLCGQGPGYDHLRLQLPPAKSRPWRSVRAGR